MAIVKTLIVKGVARFLTDAYMSTIRSGIWNGSTIQVGYGGTGVTSAKGSLYTPVFLSSSGIAACSVEIPHATKAFKINGVTFDVFTNSTGAAPTIFAPTTLAGTGGYILATNAAKTGLEWVAKPATNVTTTAVVAAAADGTTQITAALVNPFYNLLEGGAVTRSIQFTSSNITISSTTGGVISFTAKDWTGATSSAAGTAGYMPGAATGDRAKFLRGDGSWVALAPSISNGTDTNTIKITVGGENSSDYTVPYATYSYRADFSLTPVMKSVNGKDMDTIKLQGFYCGYNMTNAAVTTISTFLVLNYSGDWGNLILFCSNNRIYHRRWTDSGGVMDTTWHAIAYTSDIKANAVNVAGYVAAPTANDNKNQVWMTNTSGEPAWRTIDVATAATLLAKVSKSLKVDTWTDMGAVSTYTGTYAIQISSGNVMASGVFTACGGTDSVIDEIPLHVADKGTNTWRPYARISAGQLQMTTNEATGTSREYTIKILKLI